MSENDQAIENLEVLLNRTLALEMLIAIIMRDNFSQASINRILDSLRQQGSHPDVTVPSADPLHKYTPALSFAVEDLHKALAELLIRKPSSQ